MSVGVSIKAEKKSFMSHDFFRPQRQMYNFPVIRTYQRERKSSFRHDF